MLEPAQPLPIRVAIADDHKVLRQALMHVLAASHEFQFVIEATNGRDLLSRMTNIRPEVVLLDIQMPEMNGIEALKLIHERYPEVKVLMLSAFPDEVFILECLQFGISGFLTKDMEITDIARAIRAAQRNEVYGSNPMSHAFMKSYALKFGKTDHLALPSFSPEEIRILEFLRDEVPTEEISRKMCLSKRSIELKRDKMREKAHARTITGLILYALKRGLLSPSMMTYHAS